MYISQQVTVTQKSRVKNTIDEFRVGKLFMIDLAGSERAAQTKVSNPDLKQKFRDANWKKNQNPGDHQFYLF